MESYRGGRASALGLALLLFITPLVFHRGIASVFNLPQALVLRFGAGLLVFFWLARVLFTRKIQIPWNSLAWPVLAFLMACGFCALFSPDRFTSFFGSYGLWFWGLWSVGSYAVIFFAASHWASHYRMFLKAALLSSFMVSLYAIIQSFGWDPWIWTAPTKGRPSSTLGNPNYLGAFSAMMFPISLYFFFNPRSGFLTKRFAACVAVMNFYACLLSQTRGAWLGLFGGLCLALFLLRKNLKILGKPLSVLMGACVLAGALSLFFSPSASLIIERGQVFFSRREGSAGARLSLWKSAFKIFKDHPLKGVGLDSFGLVFPRYQELQHARLGGRLMIATNAHNEPLQVATTTGLLGFIPYIWLWVGVAILVLKSSENLENNLLVASLAGSILALQIHSFFNFSVSATSAYLWCWMGLAAGQSASQRVYEVPISQRLAAFFLAVCFIVSVFLISLGGRFLLADSAYKQGEAADKARRFLPALMFYRTAKDFEKHYYPAYTRLARTTIAFSKLFRSSSSGTLLHEALRFCAHVYELSPSLPEASHNVGMVYYHISKNLGDDQAKLKAVEFFKKSVKNAPFYPEFWAGLGNALELLGDKEEAMRSWRRALEIAPHYVPAMEALGPYLAKKEVRFYDQEITLKNFPLGRKVALSEAGVQTLKLVNLEEADFSIEMEVVPWEDTFFTLKEGYEPAEDVGWFEFQKKEFLLKGYAVEKIDGTLFLPKRRRLKGRKFLLIIFAKMKDLDPVIGAYARLYVETEKK